MSPKCCAQQCKEDADADIAVADDQDESDDDVVFLCLALKGAKLEDKRMNV